MLPWLFKLSLLNFSQWPSFCFWLLLLQCSHQHIVKCAGFYIISLQVYSTYTSTQKLNVTCTYTPLCMPVDTCTCIHMCTQTDTHSVYTQIHAHAYWYTQRNTHIISASFTISTQHLFPKDLLQPSSFLWITFYLFLLFLK